MHKDWQNVTSQIMPYTDKVLDRREVLFALENFLAVPNKDVYMCILQLFTFLGILIIAK